MTIKFNYCIVVKFSSEFAPTSLFIMHARFVNTDFGLSSRRNRYKLELSNRCEIGKF